MNVTELEISENIRGKGVSFKHQRRITGYLVDDLSRFNSGKRAEEKDRVKHGVSALDTFTEVDEYESLESDLMESIPLSSLINQHSHVTV